MADTKKIIKDLGKDFGGSNEDQMAGVQLLKGLATSDDDLANKFMKKLDKATSEISKELASDESVEESEESLDEVMERDRPNLFPDISD